MREIEIKAKIRNTEQVVQALKSAGCVLGAPKKQHDVVYGLPGAIGPTKGANWLRIRIEDDQTTYFTLKRQVTGELDSIEHEVVVDNASELEHIIKYLGYELFSDLTKLRRKGKLGDIEICLDEVAGLGMFIEAEKLCPEESNYDEVAKELWKLLETLHISKDDEETSGYDILLRQKEAQV